MRQIIIHFMRNAWRNQYLKIFACIMSVAFVISAVNNVLVLKVQFRQYDAARNELRNAWIGQGPKNPHSSGHYGHYVFRPAYATHALDNGIAQFTGSVLRLEAHMQHLPQFSPAEGRTESSRLGSLSFSWLMLVIMPLFIILLGHDAISNEREKGNLRLHAAQGLDMRKLLWGKVLGILILASSMALAGLIIQLGFQSALNASGSTGQDLLHTLVWGILCLVYFFIIAAVSVTGSTWSRSSMSSLLLQVSVWVVMLIIMPRITAAMGSRLHPFEQRSFFNNTLRQDREKGIDGHNPMDERNEKFKDSLLRHYKVKTLEELPVNADGLAMQADEEYANLVYDKHFNRIRETMTRQNNISAYASLLDPYLAVRNLSMSITQADYHHQLRFLKEAENYRRYLIGALNEKMAYGGSKTGEWDWTTDADFWSSVNDFRQSRPDLMWALRNNHVELICISAWVMLSAGLLFVTAAKMKII